MKEFTDAELVNMKNEFVELINSITRGGIRKQELLDKLENSDFYIAPASTRFHNSIRGGLLNHSLNVYHNLNTLVHTYGLQDKISEDTVKILGLLHDMGKINYYKPYFKNEKRYWSGGSKHDEGGNFDWVTVQSYTVVDDKDRFLFGNHEQTCEYMVSIYVPLTYTETIALLHHHAGMGSDCAQDNVSAIFNRYPLATLLHTADMLSVYLEEYTDEQIY